MTSFVLVHGGLRTSWCWRTAAQNLRSAGHLVEPVEMPGRTGAAALARIDLSSYVAAVAAAIERAEAPVVLVLHSVAGGSGSVAAEMLAPSVAHVVLVNALLMGGGQSALELLTRPDCLLMARQGALVPSQDGATLFVDSAESAIEAFYNCCDPAAAAEAPRIWCPNPSAYWLNPYLRRHSVLARFRRHTSVRGKTRKDNVVPWELQQQIASQCSARFVELAGDHSLWLSAADNLLTVLDET